MSLAAHSYLLAFLPLSLLAYYFAPHRYQNRVLLGFSLLFYCWLDLRLGLFLAHAILVTYAGARLVHGAPPARARLVLTAAVSLVLGAMVVPKYADFMLGESARWLGVPADWRPGWPLFQEQGGWLLPFGISFYTFQSLSYLIDVARGRAPERSLERYALFVSFFPQLVAGPIMRADELLDQFRTGRRFDPAWLGPGLYLILKGLFYKIALADRCGEIVAAADITDPNVDAWRVLVFSIAFSWQVFFDFHGYTTIARGSARLFGIDLKRNFYFPFYAASFADHWRRWHVTLSAWLKEYLYVGLGGNRRGRIRMYANIMITMLLGGLWHGAGWNYLAWGGLHGLYLIAERLLGLRDRRTEGLTRFAACCLVYTLALPAFGIFAMDAVREPLPILHALAGFGGRELLLLCAAVLATVGLSRLAIYFEQNEIARRRGPALALSAGMLLLLLLSGGGGREFIYYQF